MNCLATHFILCPTRGSFRDRRMRTDRFFDLAGPQTVSGNIDHIVGAAQNEEVTICVLDCIIERGIELLCGKLAAVVLCKYFVIFPNCWHAPWRQRKTQCQNALFVCWQPFARSWVDDASVIAGHGDPGRSRPDFGFLESRQQREDWPSGLCLPIVINYRCP